MTKEKDEIDEAKQIATALLQTLWEYEVDPIIAQAAVGGAWYRICRGNNYTPSDFRKILDGIAQTYEESYRKEHDD